MLICKWTTSMAMQDEIKDRKLFPVTQLMNLGSFICFIFLAVADLLTNGQEDEINSNHIYREEYETYETLQRHKFPHKVGNTDVELAETEYRRPSFYLSVPFRSQNGIKTIPENVFSQLTRQHIARNRMKLLAAKDSQNDSLQAIHYELRQTPFRRWSATNGNYKEKLRQWKAEMKSRLQGLKMPEQVIPPPQSDGEQTDTVSREEPYYVTYNPQTKIYQISNRPPSFVYTETERKDDDRYIQQNDTTDEMSSKPTKKPKEEIPLLVILQKTLPLDKSTSEEHKASIVSSIKQQNIPNGKQILFLDDYDEKMNEGDYKENEEA